MTTEQLLARIAELEAVVTRVQTASDIRSNRGSQDRQDGWNAAMIVVRLALGKTCQRCGGSGVDPDCTGRSCCDTPGCPNNLEPCPACQDPTVAELTDQAQAPKES